MNRLPLEKQADIFALLVEGNSVRGTARRVGVTLNTTLRNLVWLGEACYVLHGELVRGLTPIRIEADELWTFVYAKDRTVPKLETDALRSIAGTRWTWLSIDPDSKLVVNWHIGGHEQTDAQQFMDDLATRIPGRFQLTTDQLMHYRPAVENAFGNRVDYATIQKKMNKATMTPDFRYEQPILRTNRKASVFGNPDKELVTTTTIEAQNLRLRMANRRYGLNERILTEYSKPARVGSATVRPLQLLPNPPENPCNSSHGSGAHNVAVGD